jgi:phage tail-like protein
MAIGKPRQYHKKFKFVVEVDGFGSAGFQKCSAIEAEVAVVEQYEGGSLIPQKDPGRVKVTNITLTRGATTDEDMFKWFKEVVDLAGDAGGGAGGRGTGKKDPEFKRNLSIVQLDRDGSELRRWSISGAWPCKFNGGEWDNDADENVIESVELCYDIPDREDAAA